MPRKIFTHLPGGLTGKVRKHYAVVQKLCLLEEAYRLCQESNLSLRGTAAELGVHHSLLVKWTKDLARLQSTPRSKKRSIFDGPNGQLHPIEHELLMFIFSQREQGINVKHTLVVLKASLMLPNSFGTLVRGSNPSGARGQRLEGCLTPGRGFKPLQCWSDPPRWGFGAPHVQSGYTSA